MVAVELSGGHVLLTGGSRGLGLAMAHAFARAGGNLTLVARQPEPLEKAAADIGGRALVADLGDPGQVDGLIERAERLAGTAVDLLVLNAGIDVSGRFDQLSRDDLQRLWQLNLGATADLIRQGRESMAARQRGHIVVMSSLSAQVAMPGLAAYAASKAAVSQLVIGLRRELRQDGINTTLVEIGQATTDLYATAREHPPTAKAFDRALRFGILRDLSPDEVAQAVVSAVGRDKQMVIRPRRARLQSVLSHTPQLVADRIFPPA